MKKTNIIPLIVLFLATADIGYCGNIAAPYQVGTWSGFRAAAITYTFDDGCSNQFAIAIPMFNEPNFSFKLTMYPVINWRPDWSALKAAAAAGHEVGSHTVSHTNLAGMSEPNQILEYSGSRNIINSYIQDKQCVTIAYPFCHIGSQSIIDDYFISGRVCSGQIVQATPSNFYQISSIVLGSQGVNTTAGIIAKFDAAISAGGWCVFLLHGIDGDGGYSPISSAVLRESLQYLDSNRDKFWVQTFGNVIRYIKERNDASITETSDTGDSITLQITDTLDNSIYNFPITIRRVLPAGWTNVNGEQNERTIPTSVVDVNSVTYVIFDAVPDGGPVTLKKSPVTEPAESTAAKESAL